MRNNPLLPNLTTATLRLIAQFTDPSLSVMEWSMSYIADAGAITTNLTEMTAFLTQWQVQVNAAWKACMPTDGKITGFIVQDIRSGTAPSLVAPITPIAGTVVSTNHPSYTAVCLRKTTAYKGQRGQGRLYVGCVPLSFITPGVEPNTLNAGAIAAYQALATALLLPVPLAFGRTFTPAVTGKPVTPSTLVLTGAVLAGLSVDPTVATSRRRKLGRGR